MYKKRQKKIKTEEKIQTKPGSFKEEQEQWSVSSQTDM